jgi:hypothetical protein
VMMGFPPFSPCTTIDCSIKFFATCFCLCTTLACNHFKSITQLWIGCLLFKVDHLSFFPVIKPIISIHLLTTYQPTSYLICDNCRWYWILEI